MLPIKLQNQSPNTNPSAPSIDAGNNNYMKNQDRSLARQLHDTFNGLTPMPSITKADFDQFFQAYLTAALWSSTDGDGEPLDKDHTVDDIDQDCLETLKAHAFSFWSRMWYYLEHEKAPFTSSIVTQAGYDFWLTSQGHGSGYWDGDWPKYGDMFTKLAKCYPEEIEITFKP
jgi:hypothetical protein